MDVSISSRNVKSMKALENIGFRMLARIEENILDKKSNMLADDYFLRGNADEVLPRISHKIRDKDISVL